MPAAVEDIEPAGVRDPMLEVRTGVDVGARLLLEGGRVTAGRGSSCDLVMRDTTVSREHAAFVRRGDAWWVIDLGSTNGTRVNGLRAAEHPIAPGDRIELGDVVVELVEA
jgi:pSer/pThr/pTyr-binding forkhead associated (FHA) protein